ncbi:MAG: SPOR domain-containing protein [Firmicutes bacterium]|nr:SPOR domain-containing protein [Bacillota bacterium]
MILAVFLGYLTARFVVGPIIGYDADESPTKIVGQTDKEQDDTKDKKEKKEDEGKTEKDKDKDAKDDSKDKAADKTDDEDQTVSAVPAEGYALQFGAFSTKEAAESLAEALKGQGIKTEIIKSEDIFKVISPVVDTKKEAIETLETLADKDVTDVFVTSFS